MDVKDDDDSLLEVLLQGFNLVEVYQYLKAAKVTYKSLQYIEKEDLKEAIPPLGLRIEFREKLIKWRKQQFNIDDETISIESKVDNYMFEKDFSGKRVLNKSLIGILKETAGGRGILEYRTKKLTTDRRDFLIKLIVEEAICSQIKIRIPDFPFLVDEIVSVFPSERELQGYYFISKGCKGSPSGKLYCKYKNFRRKRGKFDSSLPTQDESTSEHLDIDDEIDESVATAFKTSLNRDSSDWEDVCEKWKRTFKIRRRELQNLNNIEFLQSWPKLGHAKASDLINIDFDFLYPGKNLMLFSKWEQFKNKIFGYYEKHIVNEVSKQLVTKAKESENIDYQDVIITVLLNSIFQSSARFKNKDGKKNEEGHHCRCGGEFCPPITNTK